MSLSNTQILLLSAAPLLSPKEEKALFLRLEQARKDVEDLEAVPDKQLHEHSQLWAAKNRVKKFQSAVVAANLPLVVRMAQRMECPGIMREQFVSEGLLKLLECIEAFDVNQGFKFSTYLYRPLYRHFYRFMKKEQKRNAGKVDEENVFRTEVADEGPESTADVMDAVHENRAGLTELEMTLVIHHFGLGNNQPKTLKELHVMTDTGKSVGWLQQQLAGAIQKLRNTLVGEDIDEVE